MINQRGAATTDFLFALILVSGFSFIIFALSMTLTMVEVVQYMTFASARQNFAANNEPEDQRKLGYYKFMELKSSPTLAPLFKGGWFQIDQAPSIAANPEYQNLGGGQTPETDLFVGTYIRFTSKVLDFSIPLYGSTADDDLRGGNTFSLNIGSYLGREVTHGECENMVNKRWSKIRQLDSAGSAAYNKAGDGNFIAIYDNGC